MYNQNLQLIIPMSGIGKRFKEAGYKDPKPLIEVDGKPIIEHVVNIFKNPKDIIFICNEKHLKETNMREILLRISPQAKIYSVPDENRRGPVDAVLQIADFIDDDKETIVSYCDYGTRWDYEGFLNDVKEKDSDGAIICYTGFHPHMLGSDNYAFVKMAGDRAEKIQEKMPFTDKKMAELASNGAYYFSTGRLVKTYFQKLIDLNHHVNNEFYVSLVYNLLIQDGLKVTTYLIKNMLQWGTPKDLEEYKSWSNYFLNKKEVKSANPPGTTLILPMAGSGSRFAEKGYKDPKPFIDVDGSPMFVKAIEGLPKNDKTTLVCLNDHLKLFDDDIVEKTNIVSLLTKTDGQAITSKIGIENSLLNKNSPIFISSCDNSVSFDDSKYLELVNDKSIDVIVWAFKDCVTSQRNPDMYSWLSVDDGFITNVSTKKFNGESHAIIGTFFFRKPKFFLDALEFNVANKIKTNGEYYIDDVIQQNIKSGLRVKLFEVDSYICWGTPNDYQVYNYWLNYFIKKNETITNIFRV